MNTTDGKELYRYYDANGTLLYVGISWSAINRFKTHNHREHPWIKEVVTIRIERFTVINGAAKAERLAIERERPIHNIKSVPKRFSHYALPELSEPQEARA